MLTALAELESGEQAFLLQKIEDLPCARARELETAAALSRERVAGHLDALAAAGRVRRLGEQWATTTTARHWELLLIAAVERCHRDQPLLPGIPHATLKGALPARVAPKAFEELLAAMVAAGMLEQREEHVARPGFVPQTTGEQQRPRGTEALERGERALVA